MLQNSLKIIFIISVSLNGYGLNHCIGGSDMVIQPIFVREIDIECFIFNVLEFSKVEARVEYKLK